MTLLKPSRRDILKMSAAAPALALSATKVAATGGPKGDQAPGYFRFSIGDAKLTVISDGNFFLPGTAIGVNVDRAEVEAFMVSHFLETSRIFSHTNHVVIELGDAVVLVDVGSGNRVSQTAGRMLGNLEAAGIDYDSITHVMLTHAHPDHIWGIRDDFDESIFPDAQYFISEAEHKWWLEPGRVDTVRPRMQNLVIGAVNSLNADYLQLNLVQDGHEIAPGMTMISTSGHTPGHMSLHLESQGKELIVTGDVTRNAYFDFERPNWISAPDMDGDKAVIRRKWLLDWASNDRITMLGYHFPFPGVGHAVIEGDAYRFIPALWLWE